MRLIADFFATSMGEQTIVLLVMWVGAIAIAYVIACAASNDQ